MAGAAAVDFIFLQRKMSGVAETPSNGSESEQHQAQLKGIGKALKITCFFGQLDHKIQRNIRCGKILYVEKV